MTQLPQIIQGGMGVAISSWTLARAVAMEGQLGVVSGTGIDTVLTRRLQFGDIGGHIRRAFDHFPFKEIAERVWEQYFVEGGIEEGKPFKSKPIPNIPPSKTFTDLVVLSNFVEVFLAKEGHDGLVGINLLEKIQIPNLASIFGAMLAGVDYVIMGAGIPRAIPGIIARFAKGQPAEMEINVTEIDDCTGPKKSNTIVLDPADYGITEMKRPKFLAVVSSASLGQLLAKKCEVPVDGFVIEGPTAGGHNAPPRGNVTYNELGEPIYGERDVPDLAKFRELGLPFWMAGSYAGILNEALAEGAAGIQVGTAFAFCNESGMRPDVRQRTIEASLEHRARVRTDAKASPTGFPFKVVLDRETLSNSDVYESRNRICDLSYLREAYRKSDGGIGYRCAAEPIEDYLNKGGELEDTKGTMCVCNGLLATAGFPQIRKEGAEQVLITAGDDVANVYKYLKPNATSYSAKDVIERLLSSPDSERTEETRTETAV